MGLRSLLAGKGWNGTNRASKRTLSEEAADASPDGSSAREKQPNEWVAMLSRLQKSVREHTEFLLNELEDQKFSEIQLQKLARSIADDLSSVVASAQTQVETVRKKSNQNPVGMSLALQTFSVIVNDLHASTIRYTHGLELTDPSLLRVTVHQVGEPSAGGLLGLPSPDSQPLSAGQAASAPPQQVAPTKRNWTPKPPELSKRVVSAKAEKLATELENTYASLLDTGRSILASLAVPQRVTRLEVRTAISKLETLQLWLLNHQQQMIAKYAATK